MAELYDKEIFRGDMQDMQEQTLEDFIAFLQELAAEQPCPANEITVEFQQYGDVWDGYDIAYIIIRREETPEEAADRRAKAARAEAERRAAQVAEEKRVLAHLLAKHGPK